MLRCLRLAAACMALWLGLANGPALAQIPGQTEVAPLGADMLLSDSANPPPADALWLPVTLPDNWAQRGFHPAGATAAWYRVAFDVPPALAGGAGAVGSWALYLPYLHGGGRVWLNWRPLGDVTESSASLQVQWQRPHLLNIADGALKPGSNLVLLRVPVDAVAGPVEVPRLVLGPADDMLAVYEQRLFYVRTVAQFTVGLCTVVGLLVLFIWWRRREEVLYGVFGLCSVLWGIHALDFVIEALPPGQWALWEWLDAAAVLGFTATLAWFTRLAWQRRQAESLALGLCIVVASLAAVHDTLLWRGSAWLARLAPVWVEAHVAVLPYAVSAVLLVMGLVLVNRFIRTLYELESLNRTLDRRVAEREAVIEQNYQRLADLEGQRLAGEERQRILQDMHDGLGAQLFSSLSRAERDDLSRSEMSDALRSCIAEMRLAIDVLSTSEDTFETALIDFRYRWEPQLKALGIASSWQLDLGDQAPTVAPHNTLQVLRILQEALTNVLKHAQARQVRVVARFVGGTLHAEVEDDGVGLPESLRAAGRGLRNMQTRAGRLGGVLAVESTAGRTRVDLSVPAASLGSGI